jgi:hypothetical protein
MRKNCGVGNGARAGHEGGDDCVICAKENPDDGPIEISQVIEGLSYHKEEKRAELRLVFVVHNPNTVPMGFRIIHRANVVAELARFHPAGMDEGLKLIHELYGARIRLEGKEPGQALFFPRISCLTASEVPDTVSLAGPGGVLKDPKHRIPLQPEFAPDPGKPQSYTSFRIPPLSPGERTLFVVRLTIPPDAYQYLIDDRTSFSVGSYTRILRAIRALDLATAPEAGRHLFETKIAPERCHLVPAAYDIVIFQDRLGDPVDVHSESMFITRVHPIEHRLAHQVLWYFGNPVEEFYLQLSLPRFASVGRNTRGFAIEGAARI